MKRKSVIFNPLLAGFSAAAAVLAGFGSLRLFGSASPKPVKFPKPRRYAAYSVSDGARVRADAIELRDSALMSIRGRRRNRWRNRAGFYCHACSVAGGAERAIYHAMPLCKS